jgi:hypothetical protein
VLNPHHPRIFLREDDDGDMLPHAGVAGRAASAGNASAPPGGTGGGPKPRTPIRNTADPGNTGGTHERKRRIRRNGE